MSSNSELIAVARPLNAGNSIVWPYVTQFCDFAIWCWPEVDAWTQTYSQDVLLWPVNEVKIEVILKTRCIQNFIGWLCNRSLFLVLGWKEFFLLKTTVDWQGYSLIFFSLLYSFYLLIGHPRLVRNSLTLLLNRRGCNTLFFRSFWTEIQSIILSSK